MTSSIESQKDSGKDSQLLARERTQAHLKRRHAAERRFRWAGRSAVAFGVLCVVILFTDIIGKGIGAFRQTYIEISIHFDSEQLGLSPESSDEQINQASFNTLFRKTLQKRFPQAETRAEQRQLASLFTSDAPLILRNAVLQDRLLLGQEVSIALLADDDSDVYIKYAQTGDKTISRLTELQQTMLDQMSAQGLISLKFNWPFFTNSDSREPELAGIKGALVGSLLTLLVTLVLSFPIAVATAIYLEEFAPKNRFTDLIEVNINNLAAVPSVIFGLLGLAVFINFFGMPRSIPLVGGLVLTLMTLPTIIISSRAAIKAVPPSIRDAAIGMGASKVQTVVHHVLPLAMPGMLTGTIIGMAQALGETAPLLMIGMVAFIVDTPTGITDPATVLPVQIFLWSDSPERAFVEKTSAAIMVLLAFLISMNGLAVWLRRKLERRW